MTNTALAAISKDRLRLGNQYAHIDYLEDVLPNRSVDVPAPTTARATASPVVVSAADVTRAQREAQRIQKSLWRHAVSRNNGVKPADPIAILDPEAALAGMGFDVIYKDGIGQFHDGRTSIDVAGLLDPIRKKVTVASQFPLRSQRFTLAHELGHAALHNLGTVVHRDRPLDSSQSLADPIEVEANQFASCFLMPEKLVRERFKGAFLDDQFVVSEESTFALAGLDIHDFRKRFPTRRHLSTRLAGAERFNGMHLPSLADQFQVSVLAMAIRLEELDLVVL